MLAIGIQAIVNWKIGCSLMQNIGFAECKMSKVGNQGIRNGSRGCVQFQYVCSFGKNVMFAIE